MTTKFMYIDPMRAHTFKNGVQGLLDALKGTYEEPMTEYCQFTDGAYEKEDMVGILTTEEVRAALGLARDARVYVEAWHFAFNLVDVVEARAIELAEKGVTPRALLLNDILNSEYKIY